MMSDLYGSTHRALQERHGTGRLADMLEALAHPVFDETDAAFIRSAAMFFLSTVDDQGRPTVSYKGGAPGFVRLTGPGELVFPSYDGNGMFLSLGNLAANPKVGLLFIDFTAPRRLRVQGEARIAPDDDPLLAEYPGADLLVRVAVETIFVNCGRYIHPAGSVSLSRHIPDAEGRQPFPAWKRIAPLAETLGPEDRAEVAAAGGPIEIEAYRGEELPPET
jgi:uncharacterized protein